ncbi:MAG: hypothetical protein RBT35_06010 [Bacteroidales bacterium]|jgi:hypothetical protein|nr:hypothetical protein [Bacteroidales bacterium]
MERYCRECGKEIHGRSDKIYCSDGCRNSFNNCKGRENRFLTESVNRTLKRNFKILKDITNSGKRVVSREVLTSMGFDFRYVTSVKPGKDGKIVMQCYNYSYVNSSKDVIYISLKNN